MRGLGAENRGLGGRWGAARGLKGAVGDGGNRAVRDWIGGSLKELGTMIMREEETVKGERDLVTAEVIVSLFLCDLPLLDIGKS